MLNHPSHDRWIICPHPRPDHRLRLFCFSYAGGGASLFRSWSEDLPTDIEVCAIQLPGRESRLAEPPLSSMRAIVDALSTRLAACLDGPFAFLGHSMGALVAFELACELRRRHMPGPTHLVLSAHAAAHLPPRRPPLHQLDTDLFIERIRAMGGTPAEVFQSPELVDLMLPSIRADFTVCETYVPRDEPPLDCRITALGGIADPDVDESSLWAWSALTRERPFSVRLFPGGHFFIREQQQVLLQTISQELRDSSLTLNAPVLGAHPPAHDAWQPGRGRRRPEPRCPPRL